MRVFVDVGWMQERIDESFLAAFRTMAESGGPSLDLRVAIDGSNPPFAIVVRETLRRAVPASAISAYTFTGDLADQLEPLETIRDELRRRHAEALMPDVALTIRGYGAEGLPPGLPIVDWCPEDDVHLSDTLAEACKASPGAHIRRDDTLNAFAETLRKSGLTVDVEDLGSDLIRSARIGEEAGAPRLLIDVSYITTIDHGAGIQRVVHSLIKSLCAQGPGRRFESIAFVAAREPDRTQLCHVNHIGAELGPPLRMRTGDTLLMLDAAWEAYPSLVPRLEEVRRYGGRIVTVVYDIIPLRRPDLVADALPQIFERWFRAAVATSDALVCISKAVADDVVSYIREENLTHRDGLRIGWWHLGSDLPIHVDDRPSEDITGMLDDDTPTFLMVGTVEARKRHAVALDAVELLWRRGRELKLLILGREGWHVSNTVRRLREHEEAGKRLLWKSSASDADIQHAYERSTALLYPSVLEGFGLPIVEAAINGLGSIVSDIPPLREIGGEGLIYFPTDDPAALANAIEGALEGTVPDHSTVKTLSWAESALHLLEVLDHDRFEYLLRVR